jgi:hypothetical protein
MNVRTLEVNLTQEAVPRTENESDTMLERLWLEAEQSVAAHRKPEPPPQREGTTEKIVKARYTYD